MGTLFIISTPIGNLKDITFRAMECLFSLDILACEDTRHTGLLLHALKEKFSLNQNLPKLFSFYEQNEINQTAKLVTMLKNGKNVGLVSDAGTPLINDPGYRLVNLCSKYKIQVVSLPGPSAFLTALVAAGLPVNSFSYFGFLSDKTAERIKIFKEIKKLSSYKFFPKTLAFYVSPHILPDTLLDLKETIGDAEIVLAKELTKIHESITRDKISSFLKHFSKNKPVGEYVLLFNLSKH